MNRVRPTIIYRAFVKTTLTNKNENTIDRTHINRNEKSRDLCRFREFKHTIHFIYKIENGLNV
jgi:hypothetical protein